MGPACFSWPEISKETSISPPHFDYDYDYDDDGDDDGVRTADCYSLLHSQRPHSVDPRPPPSKTGGNPTAAALRKGRRKEGFGRLGFL